MLATKLRIEGIGSRPKTLESTVAKLRRQTARLSQINDIAGCRVVVGRLAEQDRVVEAISEEFAGAIVRDFRDRPQNGYRAVHVIVDWDGRPVEIQIRTRAQNLWANISEAASDRWGIEVKYGGGPTPVREVLDSLSPMIDGLDENEQQLADEIRAATQADRSPRQQEQLRRIFEETRAVLDETRSAIAEVGVALTEQSKLFE